MQGVAKSPNMSVIAKRGDKTCFFSVTRAITAAPEGSDMVFMPLCVIGGRGGGCV